MLNRLLLPLISLLIIWLGYTIYQLIQEDRCNNQESIQSLQTEHPQRPSNQHLSGYYEEPILPCPSKR